jgi:hypothetical protein
MYSVAVPPEPGLPPSQAKSIFTVDLPLGSFVLAVVRPYAIGSVAIGLGHATNGSILHHQKEVHTCRGKPCGTASSGFC